MTLEGQDHEWGSPSVGRTESSTFDIISSSVSVRGPRREGEVQCRRIVTEGLQRKGKNTFGLLTKSILVSYLFCLLLLFFYFSLLLGILWGIILYK